MLTGEKKLLFSSQITATNFKKRIFGNLAKWGMKELTEVAKSYRNFFQ